MVCRMHGSTKGKILEPMTPAEQALDDRIQRIRANHNQGKSSIEMAGEGLLRQMRIQTIVIAVVGTIIAIETTAVAVLRIWYGV